MPAPKPAAAAAPPAQPPAVAQPKSENAVATVSQELAMLQPEIERILPEHVSAERFMRVVATAVVLNPELRKPEYRRSLLTAATKAATDGLVPDGREGALVIFGGIVQWMPMVAGVIKKVRNSGELKSLNSNVVHAKDTFKYWIDDDGEHVQHEPNLTVPERGDITAVYAVAKTHKGGVYTEIMTRGQIDQVRKASKAPNSPAWRDWYGEMGRKAVIRRLSKRLPMSTDLETVVQRDDEMFDFDRARVAEHVSSGVGALRKTLGLPQTGVLPADDAKPAKDEADDGAGPTVESAIAALRAADSLDALEAVRAEVWAAFEGKSLPLDVEATWHDRKAALEQAAA